MILQTRYMNSLFKDVFLIRCLLTAFASRSNVTDVIFLTSTRGMWLDKGKVKRVGLFFDGFALA